MEKYDTITPETKNLYPKLLEAQKKLIEVKKSLVFLSLKHAGFHNPRLF